VVIGGVSANVAVVRTLGAMVQRVRRPT
jgi:hypothetical protein